MKTEKSPNSGESTAKPKKPKCFYEEYLLWLDRNPVRYCGPQLNTAKNIK